MDCVYLVQAEVNYVGVGIRKGYLLACLSIVELSRRLYVFNTYLLTYLLHGAESFLRS
jgi:hypothetical protein